jgi:mannose-6-phosphate isomerase-like protein (cupin superfamily)
MELSVRRVVTGHDAEGRATIVSDGPTPKPTSSRPGQQAVVVWATDAVPADNSGNADTAGQPVATALKNGTVLRVIEYQPGVAGRTHRTHSVDYAIILSGSVDMQLDDGNEVHLKAGDIVVQRGTVHNWQNRGDVPCRIAFIWIAAQPIEIAGTVLDAHG